MRTINLAVFSAIAFLVAGCGCGDTVAVRQVQISQWRGSGTWHAIEVEVPPEIVEEKIERKDKCGNPVTELRLATDLPVRVIVVPTTKPIASPLTFVPP
jgi:hypothetical protein